MSTLDASARAAFPSLEELYNGPQGIYAGCGPNGGVCHNAKQFPNLSQLGSIVEHIGDPCNQLQDKPSKFHDLCERNGDFVDAGGERRIEVAYIAPIDDEAATPRKWRIVLAEAYPDASVDGELRFVRAVVANPGAAATSSPYANITGLPAEYVTVNSEDANELLVTLPPAPPTTEGLPEGEQEPDEGAELSGMLKKAGNPAAPESIQMGDPNRNGTFGATLGGRLIRPGDPGRSYLMRRLTDPAAGPLMPLANCCYWTKTSLRAMWCWIAGLDETGSNALAPIDYDDCPEGPVAEVAYPEPGDGCEASGMCPVQPTSPLSADPTWSNVYKIMNRRCAGSTCHFNVDSPGGGLDLSDSDEAYAALVGSPLVVAGEAASSTLYQRVAVDCTPGTSCTRMPLGLEPLNSTELEAIKTWIDAGAPD